MSVLADIHPILRSGLYMIVFGVLVFALFMPITVDGVDRVMGGWMQSDVEGLNYRGSAWQSFLSAVIFYAIVLMTVPHKHRHDYRLPY